MTSRRTFLRASLVAAATVVLGRRLGAQPQRTKITIYKTPTCGCCKLWVDHVAKGGFEPTVHDLPNLDSTKKTIGVPAALQSCHTAVVGAYWVEGHVPVDLIARMVKERPDIKGIAVPGMPQGSPGMETGQKDPYDVIAVEKSGKTRVYAKR